MSIKRARYLSLIPSSAAHRAERGFAGEMQTVAQAFTAASLRGRPAKDGRDRSDGKDGRDHRSASEPRNDFNKKPVEE